VPELPEVETIVRDLQRLVTGASIRRATVLRDDLVPGGARELERRVAGTRIASVSRRAKNIVVDLGVDRLVINLGMTGRILVPLPDVGEPGHLGARFELDDRRRILYQDVRRFGRLELMAEPVWAAKSARLGIEPLSGAFDAEALHALTRTSRVAIKPWLMDQRRIVGIGNIYASEALFRARLNPRRSAQRLTRPQAGRLVEAIRAVLLEAIDFRGTTLLDYRDAAGQTGSFAQRLRVYDRSGEPCVLCGTPIRRLVQGGRSTFFCPRCQR
jgi:formamidopyrimidine-DNA glycosylase